MSKTVSIGCKTPNGIWLVVGEQKMLLNGWNRSAIIGASHGTTENVPAELWEEWLKIHGDSPLVKKGFVFAHETTAKVNDEGKEKTAEKTGMEKMKPAEKTDKAGAVGKLDV